MRYLAEDSVGVMWVDFQECIQIRNHVRKPPLPVVADSEIKEGIRLPRIQSESAKKCGFRFRISLLAIIKNTESIVRLEKIRPKLNRL
jgi:hypothetical protein